MDEETTARYYESSLSRKTEQQKQLEDLLRPLGLRPAAIADVACGGGGTRFHLSSLYPDARYTLVDSNESGIALAEVATRHLNARCLVGDIYRLDLEPESFDLVVCWQTLMALTMPELALRSLIRLCKPGGRIYASSLFNRHHDVDVYSTVTDHTRPSSVEGVTYSYNTYSVSSVHKWVSELVSAFRIHDCGMPIDLEYPGRGLGTHTVRLESGERLQISAGMLLNWGILELQK